MFEERTEPATPRRRRKAREEGQVARSAELAGAAVLLGVLWGAPYLMPALAGRVSEFAVWTFARAAEGAIGDGTLRYLTTRSLLEIGAVVGPVLGLVAVAALVGNVVQVGFCFSARPLAPKLSRLDPLQGWKRLLTTRSVVELAKGMLKVAIVATCAWRYLIGHRDRFFELVATEPTRIGLHVGELAHGMALQIVELLLLLAALDYGFQRWQLERALKMTKQEVKEELKEIEGHPEIRVRIRSQQRQLARRRMMADVAVASVVITNPTHYAVALAYRLGEGGAPKVVAKGRDRIALKIREVAFQHQVPCVENALLARSLYQLVEIGEEIPPSLYRAVAEVLALVWREDRRAAGIGPRGIKRSDAR